MGVGRMSEIIVDTRTPGNFGEWRRTEPYVGEDAIYIPCNEYVYEGTETMYQQLITKELFQEAFKEYIVKEGLLNVQSKEHKD